MAGTSKSRSFFVTTTAGEDETSEGNPENSSRGAVDVAPSVPAPENEAARNQQRWNQPRRKPARRGPVVRELDLTLDNPTDRALIQLGTLTTELRTTIIHHGPCRPKRMATDAFSREKNTTMHILGQWKQTGNGSASRQRRRSHIVKCVGCSVIHRQCKNSGPTVCRATRRTSEWTLS